MPIKTYLTVNDETAKCKEFSLSKEEIDKIKAKLAKIPPKKIRTAGYPISIIALTDKEGKIAFTKTGYLIQKNKRKRTDMLVVEFPLLLDSQAQREWIKTASNFFKPLLSKDFEIVKENKDFTKITKRPFREQSFEYYDPDDPENTVEPMRYRMIDYTKKAPYGSKTKTATFIKKRNHWIKSGYKKLRDKRTPELKAYDIIQKELTALPSHFFGKTIQPKGRKSFKLSIDHIKKIVQSRNS